MEQYKLEKLITNNFWELIELLNLPNNRDFLNKVSVFTFRSINQSEELLSLVDYDRVLYLSLELRIKTNHIAYSPSTFEEVREIIGDKMEFC